MSDSTSNLTKSLTKVKSKISSKFKNTANVEEMDQDQLLAMKYDDLPQQQYEGESSLEMRPSKSFTSLNNIAEEEEEEKELEVHNDKLLPPISVAQQIPQVSSNITSSSSHASSIQEKEFSFLQQHSSNPASPINPTTRRKDSVIDPLTSSSSSLLHEKLNSQVLSPQPTNFITTSISQTTTSLINTNPTNPVSNTRRKSSNFSNVSNVSLQQPITPTNEITLNQFEIQENLEFADAVALSILDKVGHQHQQQGVRINEGEDGGFKEGQFEWSI